MVDWACKKIFNQSINQNLQVISHCPWCVIVLSLYIAHCSKGSIVKKIDTVVLDIGLIKFLHNSAEFFVTLKALDFQKYIETIFNFMKV